MLLPSRSVPLLQNRHPFQTGCLPLEELCYYITVHADMLDQRFMREDLADAVEQMELFDLAEGMQTPLKMQQLS